MKRFESPEDLVKENFDVSGGAIVSADEGCGLIASGQAVYFYQVKFICIIKNIPVLFLGIKFVIANVVYP